jgi:DNA-binding transcriptional regulator YdaS (Cro superfamily)
MKRSNGLGEIRAHRGMAAKLARNLKVNQSTISRWEKIPAELVVIVERITGIPREKLRPDLYK